MEPAQNNDALTNQPPKEGPDSEPVSTVMPDGVTSSAPESAANPSIVNVTDSTAVETDTPSTIPSATVANSVAQPVAGSTVAATEPSLSSASLSTMPPAQPVADATATTLPVNDSSTVPDDSSQAPVTSGPVISGELRKSRKKFFLFGGVALLLVLLLVAGWVFGMYLPNKPENVWKTGFDRTGQALDAIVSDATSTDRMKQIKASQVTGDLRYKADATVTGKISGQFDDNNSDSNFEFKIDTGSGQPIDVSAKLRTMRADAKAQYPDVYYQVAGIAGSELAGIIPNIDQYDGKWIVITGDYLTETIGGTSKPATTEKPLSAAEVTEAARAITDTSREYFLTGDTDKAVVGQRKFVGKEHLDGVDAYHYVAAINTAHGKAFCSAFGDTLAGTKAYKKLVAENERSDRKQEIVKGCQDEMAGIDSSDTFDLWIDTHYKLIHKIRVSDPENAKNYIDISQLYTGGDTIKILAHLHQDDAQLDVSGSLTFDFKAYTLSTHIAGEQKGYIPLTFEVNLNAKPSSRAVQPAKPAGAVDYRDFLRSLSQGTETQRDNTMCDASNPYAGACAPVSDARVD